MPPCPLLCQTATGDTKRRRDLGKAATFFVIETGGRVGSAVYSVIQALRAENPEAEQPSHGSHPGVRGNNTTTCSEHQLGHTRIMTTRTHLGRHVPLILFRIACHHCASPRFTITLPSASSLTQLVNHVSLCECVLRNLALLVSWRRSLETAARSGPRQDTPFPSNWYLRRCSAFIQ